MTQKKSSESLIKDIKRKTRRKFSSEEKIRIVIEGMHNQGSMMITSQIPVQGWYEIIGEKTIADAILDRLIHHSHRIELGGESMRRKRKLINQEIE